MAVYTDGIHLVADTLEELHEFAAKMPISRFWFDGYEKGHPHYDLVSMQNGKWASCPIKVKKALDAGAIKTDKKTVLLISKKSYERAIE